MPCIRHGRVSVESWTAVIAPNARAARDHLDLHRRTAHRGRDRSEMRGKIVAIDQTVADQQDAFRRHGGRMRASAEQRRHRRKRSASDFFQRSRIAIVEAVGLRYAAASRFAAEAILDRPPPRMRVQQRRKILSGNMVPPCIFDDPGGISATAQANGDVIELSASAVPARLPLCRAVIEERRRHGTLGGYRMYRTISTRTAPR